MDEFFILLLSDNDVFTLEKDFTGSCGRIESHSDLQNERNYT